MTTYSTAHTTQARRTPPRSQEKRSSKEQQPDNEALLIIDSEPEPSTDGPDWYYFWYKVPGQKNNANGSGKTINCREFQVSWVIEAMETNTLLQKGLHFHFEQIDTPNGPASTRWRYVLDKDFHLLEPEPEEPPMTWSQPGQEVPVIAQPQAPNQIVAMASAMITNWLTVRQTYQEFRTIPGFDDITFRAVMGATISVGRKS